MHGARAAHTVALGAAEELERPTVAGTACGGTRFGAGLRGIEMQRLQHPAERHIAAWLAGAFGEGLAAVRAGLAAAPRAPNAGCAEAVTTRQRHRVLVEA